MKVKRFFAADMRQAIRKVREALGPDAVIMSNRAVDGGIEIIASVDYNASLVDNGAIKPAPAAQVNDQPRAESPRPEKTASEEISWSQDPAIVSMREEISQLRGLLENQLAHLAWGDMDRRQPVETGLLRRLSSLELDIDLNRKISAHCARAGSENHAWQIALSELSSMLPVAGQDPMEQGGVFALIGSTGVGKTTSIAKLAARYVLRHGQRHVALVTTDSYRIGAHEQLMTYGRLLGIPVQVASDHKELRRTLNSLSDKRLVLIDTAGMSQRDVRISEQFATLADSGIPISTLLVLSATAHTSVVRETISAFSAVPLDGVILTKLDEAASLGGVLSTVINQRLPLVFTTNGQRVPEDLQPARAEALIQKAAALADDGSVPEESLMAEQFGGIQTHVHV